MSNRIVRATKYSLNGIIMALKWEQSFRWEVIASTPLFLALIMLDLSAIERVILLLPILLVFSCELINSGLEKTIDELGEGDLRLRFQYAKDCGSAAVFLMIWLTIFTWGVIIGPRVCTFFK